MNVASVWRWPVLIVAIVIPVAVAASSPLLQYRQLVYIVAGLAGTVAMAILLLQPLLLVNALPGAGGKRGRIVHLWTGVALLIAVVVHIGGLWITSPPDVIDALLFRSPTPFSLWGVIAMWSVIAAAVLGIFRRRLPLKIQTWRLVHTLVTTFVVLGTVIHALEIDGAMGQASKIVLCVFVVAAMAYAVFRLRSWIYLKRRVTSFARKS